MKNPIENKIHEWSKLRAEFREINQKVIYLERRLFYNYIPTQPPNPDFFYRLKKWLENLSDEEDQKILFELIPELFFVSEKEFDSLYRTAYNIEIYRWIIDMINLKFYENDLERKINDAVLNTWFCAATDSFRINDFFKINNIPSKFNFRPDWHTLSSLGDIKKIQDYVSQKNINRIVLLDDFIGSGDQLSSTLDHICSNFPLIQVLFVSLISCPTAIINFDRIQKKHSNLTVRHVIVIDEIFFIKELPITGETILQSKIRELVNRVYTITTNGQPIGPKPYHPLGFKKTGALIVMNINTPDNTLPAIHWESATWYPLFKRVSRL